MAQYKQTLLLLLIVFTAGESSRTIQEAGRISLREGKEVSDSVTNLLSLFTDNQSFISVMVRVFAVYFFLTEICAVNRHIYVYTLLVKHKKGNNFNKMFIVFYPTTTICHF